MDKKLVLILDPAHKLPASLSERLRNLGLWTVKAASGFEAMVVAEEHTPDLILMDAESSEGKVSRLFEDGRLHSIPILFLSEVTPVISDAGELAQTVARRLSLFQNSFATEAL